MSRTAALILASFFLLLPAVAQAEGIVVIANLAVDAPAALSPKDIAAIYLLRTTTWPDGTHIVPVNREAGSEIRTKFTSAVIREDNASLAAYWNAMHFIGKQPPLVQESEQAVLAFVQKVPGAIGYISASTPATNVKVLGHVP